MPSNEARFIRNVWADNLDREMDRLCHLVDRYPYLSMDTEFPGVVARPIGHFLNAADYHYQLLRCNVDLLKLIQLGITFANEEGRLPEGVCTWQFNFQFSLRDDMYLQESIELLANAGIDFNEHEERGINIQHFGERLISSGFVLFKHIRWISFHSGFDFAYLLKLLTCKPLPLEEADFFDLLRLYFPGIYDIKYLMKSCKTLKGGLQEVAKDLKVERIGPQHQAGSDSLLTCQVFFQMRQQFFADKIDDSKYLGYLFGYGGNTSLNAVQSGTLLEASGLVGDGGAGSYEDGGEDTSNHVNTTFQ